MTKEHCLELIKLLAALESWAFTQEKFIPDYLHDDLSRAVTMLTNEVLK